MSAVSCNVLEAVVKLNAPPNTPVFTLQAKDPDTDHNLHYFLVRDRSEYLDINITIIWKPKLQTFNITVLLIGGN